MITRQRFVEEWSEKLSRGTASLFVGAGVSIAAGYPSWRGLLRKIADELELDIEQEHDLAAVAQHHINRNRRGRLTQLIADQFPRKPVPPVLRVVARLPLTRVWTTNWEELTETAFSEARREPDVKERSDDLSYDRAGADVVVYKMHGSTRHVADVVLATDDFELYRVKREAFLRVLAGHLLSTSFLFVGVSFTDPNLGHLLAAIREMYERFSPQGAGQPHYAIVRPPRDADYAGQDNAAAKAKTAKVRHQLFVEDLKRYNIHCVAVDEYSETEAILREVEQRVALRSVFVAGSLADGALSAEQGAYVCAVAKEVGNAVGVAGKRLVSGYGTGIGNHVLSGMLGAGWLDAGSTLDRRLVIRPFPQSHPPGTDPDTFKRRYREDLVALAGACVIVCGIRARADGSGFEDAVGVFEEVDVARSLHRPVIPIGATFGAARELWRQMKRDPNALHPSIPRTEFELLGDATATPEQMGSALRTILGALGGGVVP